MVSSVFQQLPNDIIMCIIREADGGLNKHKTNFKGVISHFNSCLPVNFYSQVEQTKNNTMSYGYFRADINWWNGCEDTLLSYQHIFDIAVGVDDFHEFDQWSQQQTIRDEIHVEWENADNKFEKFLGHDVDSDDSDDD